jgi:glucokinase
VNSPLRIGVDIGATKVLGVLVDAEGTVLSTVRRPTVPTPTGIVEITASVVTSLKREIDQPGASVTGLGMGVPGAVMPGRGTVAHAVNLGVGSEEFPLAARLNDATSLPVHLENDTNVAALGALHLLGAGARDLAYLSVGTGLSAGIVLDGRLWRGRRGTAGEIGHISLDATGPECVCGQRGCLEAVASGSAIARAWHGPGEAGAGAGRHLLAAAEAGDPEATRIRDQLARRLATAVRLLVLTLDVEVVYLGGGVVDNGSILFETVVTALRQDEETSRFLASLELHQRIRPVPSGCLVAPVGAALLVPVRHTP